MLRRLVRPCNFCDAPATACCNWPVERFLRVRYDSLQAGDRVRRAVEKIPTRPPAIVEGVAPWFANHLATEAAGLQVGLRIGKRYKEIIVLHKSPVRVGRMRPCGALCCENHLRRVEPGTEYCCDHWRAWEAIAS